MSAWRPCDLRGAVTRSRRGPRLMVAGASALVALALGAPGALAAPASEVGDAGDLPDTAQRIDGDPAVALDSISGELVLADDDSRDMYRICLTGGRTFSAAAPADNFDPQLFLFDEEGRPVVANDDTGDGNIDSTIESGGLSPEAGGVYFLAISEFDFDPVNEERRVRSCLTRRPTSSRHCQAARTIRSPAGTSLPTSTAVTSTRSPLPARPSAPRTSRRRPRTPRRSWPMSRGAIGGLGSRRARRPSIRRPTTTTAPISTG